MILRDAKIFFVGCVGVLLLLVGLNNISDYGTNFAGVQHILSMDTIPTDSPLTWRAIHSGLLHHLTYDFIMAVEIGSGAACIAGAVRLLRARTEEAKSIQRRQAFRHTRPGQRAGALFPWLHDHWRGMVSDVALERLEHAGARLPLHRDRRADLAVRGAAGRGSRLASWRAGEIAGSSSQQNRRTAASAV